jgi:hypothetical protein
LNKVYWRGVLIGHVGEIKYEMPNFYGRWFPQQVSAYEDFRKMLGEDREVVYVTIERLSGEMWQVYVTAESDDDGGNLNTLSIDFRPV